MSITTTKCVSRQARPSHHPTCSTSASSKSRSHSYISFYYPTAVSTMAGGSISINRWALAVRALLLLITLASTSRDLQHCVCEEWSPFYCYLYDSQSQYHLIAPLFSVAQQSSRNPKRARPPHRHQNAVPMRLLTFTQSQRRSSRF